MRITETLSLSIHFFRKIKTHSYRINYKYLQSGPYTSTVDKQGNRERVEEMCRKCTMVTMVSQCLRHEEGHSFLLLTSKHIHATNIFECLLVLIMVLDSGDSNEQNNIICSLETSILVGETNKQVN